MFSRKSQGACGAFRPSRIWWPLAIIGPGIVVMLADTDVGSIVTAAQSGAEWGYKLLLIQFILMPVLFIAQELTVRLGATTHCGHAHLIKQHFGRVCAWISVATLLMSCAGAMVTEFSGIAGVGDLFGISPMISVSIAGLFLLLIVFTGSYRSVERIAVILGLFELVFFVVVVAAQPDLHNLLHDAVRMPLQHSHYLYLMAANIGAVIMPWMIFYQQSAVVDKGLRPEHIKAARWDTAIGAVVTQLIMAAVLVTIAATIGKTNPGQSLNTVQEISAGITQFLGHAYGVLIFSLGMIGAAMVAAIVVSLTAAWTLGEVAGYQHSLCSRPSQAPWFYIVYTLVILLGAVIVVLDVHLVRLNVAVEVMNALLLPVVLGFLFLLARKALPEKYRLKGKYAWVVFLVLAITTTLGLIGGLVGVISF